MNRPGGNGPATALLRLAKLGYAHWFFGNLYEALTRVPDRVADDPPGSLLATGSPVRYYLPGAPVTVIATVAAVATGWREPESRRPLMAAAACTALGGAATGYLVRNVNVPMLTGRLPAERRDALLRTWYRLNYARLVAAAGGYLAARCATERARQVGTAPGD